jgi:hypothetical protein
MTYSSSQSCVSLAISAIRLDPTYWGYRIAVFHMLAAIKYANREKLPRASLFRILNWLRADMRKMEVV